MNIRVFVAKQRMRFLLRRNDEKSPLAPQGGMERHCHSRIFIRVNSCIRGKKIFVAKQTFSPLQTDGL